MKKVIRSGGWLVKGKPVYSREFEGLMKGFMGNGCKEGLMVIILMILTAAQYLGFPNKGLSSPKPKKFSIVHSFHCLLSIACGCYYLCVISPFILN